MISSNTLRIAGAAVLGTLVGTGTAHAVVYDDDGTLMGQTKYALERIATRYSGQAGYYTFPDPGSGTYTAQYPLGISVGDADAIRLNFVLENMVFVDALTNASVTVQTAADRTTDVSSAAAAAVLHTGGQPGDSTATFTITRASGGGLTRDMYVSLVLGSVAIGLDATGGTGTVKLTASTLVVGAPVSTTEMSLDVIQVDPILVHEGMAPDTNPLAVVASSFNQFSGESNMASIGTLKLGVESGYWTFTGAAVETSTQLLGTVPGRNIVASGTVTFAGRTDFIRSAFLSATADCAPLSPAVPLTEDTDDGEGTNIQWLTGDDAVSVSSWQTSADDTTRHVCIEVNGMTTIPETAPYTATVAYTAVEGAVFPPVGSTFTLGRVERDGTTVHIPTLTTSDVWNQRIVIWNRGSSAVPYSFDFSAGADVGGADAMGMLQPGVTNLSLQNGDVVNLGESGGRTAATLTVEAQASQISVSTIRVNNRTKATDTVHYQ